MTISVGPYGLRCDLPPRELRPSQRSGCEPGILKSVPRPRLRARHPKKRPTSASRSSRVSRKLEFEGVSMRPDSRPR
jgi:hypothetical protein